MGPLTIFQKLFYPVKMIALIGISISGAALMGLYTFQNSLIYPASMNDGHGYCARPEEFGMPDYEDLKSPDYTNKTVLILSPNAGNIGHALPIVSMFYKNFGYNVFIYSYRGYGKLDAQAMMSYIAKDEQLSESSLVLYGRSLGGAVAIYISSLMGASVQGLILENTFLSIPKTVPHIFPFLKYFTMFVHQKWESERLVPLIPANIPVLFQSARKDEIVPPSHMDRIYELSQSTDKTFYKYTHSQHNDTVVQPEYWERVHDFIKNKVNPVGY
ncbi:uncharacterized protein CXQ87_003328 [Candidozyma duobushaemuli]|uniref:Serine aminopeptidase S33 domain-containing protein n=1 Tax=Candidozyma duobushaemuli TaxID=1231522 RepID=A0A2V1AD63_9ASCO|nr:uncharacterized protein CXQ87_003328 [[Candida] duobushaemulonis]PVH15486.1 hypothetical protein CXQ87_003328 [[Candida] duobushaemulonis]